MLLAELIRWYETLRTLPGMEAAITNKGCRERRSLRRQRICQRWTITVEEPDPRLPEMPMVAECVT